MKKLVFTFICLIILCVGFITYKSINPNENDIRKINVAEVTHSIFYAPFYSAIENGYFKDNGINVDLILTPGADSVMASVLSGDADIGLSGSEATIYVYNSGEKDYVKTFAQLTQKDGSFIVSRKKIDNFSLNDLVNKTIIGGRNGGMPEMTLEWALKDNNIDPKSDLTIDTSITFSNMASSFIGGNGDFVCLFEPVATTIEKQGYGYKVASLGTFGGNVPYTAFNAKNSFLNNNKELIKDFTKTIKEGLDFVHNNDSTTIANVIKNQFPDTNVSDLISAIDAYKNNDTWPNDTKFTEESFNHMQDIVSEAGYLDVRAPYSDLIFNG